MYCSTNYNLLIMVCRTTFEFSKNVALVREFEPYSLSTNFSDFRVFIRRHPTDSLANKNRVTHLQSRPGKKPREVFQ